jgi:hypothetical protein
MKVKDRYVYEGFKLPSTDPITENELAWIDMLRCIVGDPDPPPTCEGVLALRVALAMTRRKDRSRL